MKYIKLCPSCKSNWNVKTLIWSDEPFCYMCEYNYEVATYTTPEDVENYPVTKSKQMGIPYQLWCLLIEFPIYNFIRNIKLWIKVKSWKR